MDSISKVVMGLIIAAMVVAGIFGLVNSLNNNDKNESTKVTPTVTTTEKNIQTKSYSGECKILGKYRNRYVECTGDYDPKAKVKAETKANECNVNAKAVSGCNGIYK